MPLHAEGMVRMKVLSLVGLFGACGGLLAWAIAAFHLKVEPNFSLFVDALISVAFGAGAGMVFVYLIANTDRNDRPRLLVLALLAGFCWEPVWEMGQALVVSHNQQKNVNQAQAAGEQALHLAQQINMASGDEREELVTQLNEKIATFADRSGKIESVSSLESVRGDAKRLNQLLADIDWDEAGPRVDAGPLLAFLDDAPPAGEMDSSELDRRDHRKTDGVLPTKLAREDLPTGPQLPALDFGKTVEVKEPQGEAAKWFKFTSDKPNAIKLSATSQSSEPLLTAIYDSKTLELKGVDNKSGSKLSDLAFCNIEQGEYWVRVSKPEGGEVPPFKIELQEGVSLQTYQLKLNNVIAQWNKAVAKQAEFQAAVEAAEEATEEAAESVAD